MTRLSAHHDVIYTLAFSRDGTILASGGGDDSINLWDVRRLIEEVDHEDLNAINAPAVRLVLGIALFLTLLTLSICECFVNFNCNT